VVLLKLIINNIFLEKEEKGKEEIRKKNFLKSKIQIKIGNNLK
jgi:hypothetical protein